MSRSNLLFEQSDKLPTQKISNFEYGVLEAEMRSLVQQRTNEIKMLMRRNTQDIIDIGQKLIEVKKHLGHGNFRNWLKFEFNWSVSTATKFMQVADKFKCINFTHLNISASTLYLIAAPSTPEEARTEVLKRVSLGENIGYTEAKKIVSQHKEMNKAIVEPACYETSAVLFTQKDLADDTTQTAVGMENIVRISHNTSNTAIAEMAVSIRTLTPEQLAGVIMKAATDNGLSKSHLLAIIMASQEVLDQKP